MPIISVYLYRLSWTANIIWGNHLNSNPRSFYMLPPSSSNWPNAQDALFWPNSQINLCYVEWMHSNLCSISSDLHPFARIFYWPITMIPCSFCFLLWLFFCGNPRMMATDAGFGVAGDGDKRTMIVFGGWLGFDVSLYLLLHLYYFYIAYCITEMNLFYIK